MESVLEQIEKERFSSIYDPGIYGILKRLNSLGFVRTSFACCSGHPIYDSGKTLADDGFIFLGYNPYSPKSEEFHNKLRDISAEYKGYSIYFANAKRHQDLSERLGFLVKDSVATRFELKIECGKADKDPMDIATALSKFWQKVSDLIAEYESKPIPELLKPYYFGIRSNYGIIEAMHPAFDKYYKYSTSLVGKPINKKNLK